MINHKHCEIDFVNHVKKENKRIICFGCGEWIREILIRDELTNYVVFLVDNDVKKWGKEVTLDGTTFKIYSPDILKAQPCDQISVLITTRTFHNEIKDQLNLYSELNSMELFDYYEIFSYTRSYDYALRNEHAKKIKKFKNVFDGQRCFIIGNGPSLRKEDLEKLKGEKTFASNRIYDLYPYLSWRPDFYCARDSFILRKLKMEFNVAVSPVKNVFLPFSYYSDDILHNSKLVLHNEICLPFYPDYPQFSGELDKQIYEGLTITYEMLQIAAYMGFKTIYLLGIDNQYSAQLKPDGTIAKNDCLDHANGIAEITTEYTTEYIPQIYKTDLSYKAAKIYGDTHGIKIYNATRGGKLEIFPRVNFDDIKF